MYNTAMRGYLTITAAAAALLTLALMAASCSPGDRLHSETRTIMGTYVTITVEPSGLPEILVRAAVKDAFAQIERVDALMSTYKPQSELSRINANAGVAPVEADPEVIDTVGMALETAKETGGGFDPTIGPLVKLWGIASKDARVPSDAEIGAALKLVDYTQVEVDRDKGTVFIKMPGMSIDLGGIAKGYASDRAVDALRKAGITAGIVAVAGDLRLFGKRADGSDWGVGIQHPRDKSGLMAKFKLTDAALSTSGDYERFFIKDGVRYHHIIDPRTGYPAKGLMSVSVLTAKAVDSDAYATGLFVMGPQKAMEYADAHPELDVLLVRSDGTTAATGRFREVEAAPVSPG